MIDSTKAIVLHQIKYSDSGIVVQLYSRKYGRLACLIKGLRNKKSGKHNVLFQPLSILDMAIYYKASREIQIMKDFSASYSPSDVYSDIKKSSVAIFLGEVLTSVLREESPNETLFDFLEDSVIYFDQCREGFANFHLAFLAGLCSYLGFEPGKTEIKGIKYFDMLNGKFTQHPPADGNYAGPEISEILAAFFSSSCENINKIMLTGSVRNEVLETLVKYFSIHLPGLRKIKSLEVLKEVFN
jgi:DNA repair protein RecO (recombination protein O)